jgi:hypothetical protein
MPRTDEEQPLNAPRRPDNRLTTGRPRPSEDPDDAAGPGYRSPFSRAALASPAERRLAGPAPPAPGTPPGPAGRPPNPAPLATPENSIGSPGAARRQVIPAPGPPATAGQPPMPGMPTPAVPTPSVPNSPLPSPPVPTPAVATPSVPTGTPGYRFSRGRGRRPPLVPYRARCDRNASSADTSCQRPADTCSAGPTPYGAVAQGTAGGQLPVGTPVPAGTPRGEEARKAWIPAHREGHVGSASTTSADQQAPLPAGRNRIQSKRNLQAQRMRKKRSTYQLVVALLAVAIVVALLAFIGGLMILYGG